MAELLGVNFLLGFSSVLPLKGFDSLSSDTVGSILWSCTSRRVEHNCHVPKMVRVSFISFLVSFVYIIVFQKFNDLKQAIP